jgi:hypothetical protein
MEKVIKIEGSKAVNKIKEILAEKAYIHKMIKSGKIAEIRSDIRFVKPL